MTKKAKTYVAVYCGSSLGTNPRFAEDAREVGKLIAERDLSLVYGGGSVGLMNEAANAALKLGGDVVGVITRKLLSMEVGHKDLTCLHIVETMQERKALMNYYASAFAVLPGSIGTFEEVFEVMVLNQLDYMNKPIAFLNTDGFFDKLIEFLQNVRSNGFLWDNTYESLYFANSPTELMDYISSRMDQTNNPI